MEDIEDLLVQIEEEVSNGKRALFGSGVTVNGDVIYSLVDRIRAAVPDIMREAKAIVHNSEKRQQEESMRARNIVEQAQKRADEILANHNIIQQAEKEAEAIRAQATDFVPSACAPTSCATFRDCLRRAKRRSIKVSI